MLSDRIRQVKDRIDEACAAADREHGCVNLLAVTKNHSRDAVEQAMQAGLRCFGENRVQEAVAKFEGLTGLVDLRLIGHLQSNKCKLIPGNFAWVESIDSVELAANLSRRMQAAGKTCQILLQLNSSGEESKSGFADDTELVEAASMVSQLPGLDLRGLMTIGPFIDDTAQIAAAFTRTRRVFERVRTALPECRIDVLSMGMTDDLEIAIAEGSTEVRIGTAIFGARDQ